MQLALALLVYGSLAAAEPAQPDNLDFGTGTLAGWEGEGFYVTCAPGKGPGLGCGVCSSDRGTAGGTGYLHHAVVIPPGAGVIQFTAYAACPKDAKPGEDLDVVLFASGKRVIPKQIRTAATWQVVNHLLRAAAGRPREYIWNVSAYAGQTLRIALVDNDKGAGCHVICSGFHLIPADIFEPRDFGHFMAQLTRDHKLWPPSRFDSEHFTAMSNADDNFTVMRLNNCELIYDFFYDHFRKKGFALQKPASKLMVAIFDTQAGYEAYVGQKLPSGVVGMYHQGTNRLVVYDLGQNREYLAVKREIKEYGRQIGSELDRTRFVETLNRQAKEWRTGANIAVVMHEVSHQLSFNCGMLNREGDVPLWLAEGLATYCEATDNGAWQGIGEPNPERLMALATIDMKRIPLHDLVGSDNWLRDAKDFKQALLGYAQSWALFRMLMEEHPRAMRNYMALIYPRRTGDYRLTDFCQAFGTDLPRLELRYEQYIEEILTREYRPRRR
jgi:hypothetical protein